MDDREDRQSLTGLVASLSEETYTLFRQEIALAKAELRENLTEAAMALASVLAGGAIAFAALLVLVQALVVVLSRYMMPSLAALLVGITLAVIGFLLVTMGVKNLGAEKLVPRKTVRTLQESAATIKERVS